MAERTDIDEQTGAAIEAPNAPGASAFDAPPDIPSPKPAVAAAAAASGTLPPAPQLAPAAAAVPPPPVVRAPETRAIAAGPRAPAKPGPARVRPASARERRRFPLLAATLAIAAGLGAAVGAVGIPALIQLTLAAPSAAEPGDAAAEAQAIRSLVAQLTTDVGALRTAVEQSTKVTAGQFGKLAERIERAERAQTEPLGKIAKIGEAVERLERRAAPASSPQGEITGSVNAPPVPEAKPKPAIIDDYVVRKVFDGVALVEGRRGIIEVEPGSTLPGAGRVEEIRRQDGRWVVVTSKGLIISVR